MSVRLHPYVDAATMVRRASQHAASAATLLVWAREAVLDHDIRGEVHTLTRLQYLAEHAAAAAGDAVQAWLDIASATASGADEQSVSSMTQRAAAAALDAGQYEEDAAFQYESLIERYGIDVPAQGGKA